MKTNADRLRQATELLLQQGGYRKQNRPLQIVGVAYDFDFEVILSGPGDERNLVLLAEADSVPVVAIERRLRALTVALRRTRSMRAITLVIFVTKIDHVGMRALESICRTIPVYPADELEAALPSLLPLPIPTVSNTIVSASSELSLELAKSISEDVDSDFVKSLLTAASIDANSVSDVVHKYLAKTASVDAKESQ